MAIKFIILKNGSTVGSLVLTNQQVNYNNDIDIDFNQGDLMQVLANPISGSINFPEVIIEASWRYT